MRFALIFGVLLLATFLISPVHPTPVVQAQGSCTLYEDNHFCYDGSIGCNEPAANYSSAGQSGMIATYSCNTSAIAYIGVCDSGNSPQDDQFVLSINNQIVSENVIDTRSEYVRIYPITLSAGSYPLTLSVLRDADPPGTYRVVASTSADDVERRLGDVCGTDFAAITFEEEGSGRLITEPVPILAYASRRTDLNGDGIMDHRDSANLYLYDAYRNLERQLTSPGFVDYDPAWSPDGQTIVFASSGRAPEATIFTVPARGGPLTQITSGNAIFWNPEYSPDGREIAASCYRNSICLMNADGSNLRTVLPGNTSTFFWDPQWSPDGSKLLVVGRTQDTNRNGGVDGCDQSMLYTVNRNGSGLTRVDQGTDYKFGGDWSADGSQIIYYAAWETGNGYECSYNDEAALGVIDLRSGQSRTFIPRGRFLRTPAFSHDGTWATFTAPNYDDNRDGYLDAIDRESLVMYIFADGTQRRLTLTDHEIFDPAWAPAHVRTLPQ